MIGEVFIEAFAIAVGVSFFALIVFILVAALVEPLLPYEHYRKDGDE